MGQVADPAQARQGKKARAAARRKTASRVTIMYLGTKTGGALVDLSTTGAAVELSGFFAGVVGSSITLEAEGFHAVEGKIRWVRQRRIGIEFEASSNTAAKVNAYFKYVHQDVTQSRMASLGPSHSPVG
jgi:hypothetical protein